MMLLLRKSHPATRTMIGGDPTPEQAKAGDYPKLRQDWHGLTIAIEHPEGTVREGVDETGKPWRTMFRYAYGEILGTTGMDGDPVDVFIGNYPDAPEVYVVQQMKRKQWDVADEQKCMINFGSMDEARQAYLAHYDDPRFFGGITAIPVAEFITKVRSTREKPTMIKSILFFKGFVGPYMRGGKMVNLKGYHGSRTKKVHATTGQTSLFGDLAPPPEVKQTAKVARALTTWMQRHGGPAGMARLLADMSPEHQEKLVDAMAKIGKTDAATVRGLLADGQKAPASTGERDLFSEPEQSAAKEAPQEKPKNNLAEGLPKTEGEVIARKELTMMVNKRQENGKFSRYATGRYIITLQSAEGKKFIIAYSVMSKNGVSTTVMIPTEMLEDGAFSKLNDEAIKLFNAPSGGLFDGDKEDTITMPRAEAVKEHERLVDVLRSPSHEDDKAEAKKQAEELKEYKGEAKPEQKPEPTEAEFAEGWSGMTEKRRLDAIQNAAPSMSQASGKPSAAAKRLAAGDWASLPDAIKEKTRLDVRIFLREKAKHAERAQARAEAAKVSMPVTEAPKRPDPVGHKDSHEVGGLKFTARRIEKPRPHWRAVIDETGQAIESWSASTRAELWDKLERDFRAIGADRWRDSLGAAKGAAAPKKLLTVQSGTTASVAGAAAKQPTKPQQTRARRQAVLDVLGDGWKADAGVDGAKDQYSKSVKKPDGGRFEVTIMPEKTVEGNFYVGSYHYGGKRKGGGSNDSSAKTIEEAKAIADRIFAAAVGGDGKPAGATSRKPFDLVPDDEAITRIKAAGYEMTDAGERSVFVDGNQQKRRAFSLKHSGNGKLGVGDTVTLPIAEDMLQRIEGRAKDAKDGKLTSGANLLNASARQMRNETVDYKKPAVGEQAVPKAGGDKKLLLLKPGTSEKLNQTSSNLINNSPAITQQEKKMIDLTEDQRTKIARGGAAWEAWKAQQPEGGATRAAFKEAARSGKLDHLYAVQIKADADREAEIKASKKEKSDKWREKNVPKLAAAKQKREEQWRAEQQAKWSDPNGKRTYLRVPFDSKDEAKSAGARWDADKKAWYHTFSETPSELRRFVPVASPVAQQTKPIPQTEPKNATKRTLPTYGRVSEDDPSVWGSWLLGYEGELWSEIRRHAPDHLR